MANYAARFQKKDIVTNGAAYRQPHIVFCCFTAFYFSKKVSVLYIFSIFFCIDMSSAIHYLKVYK